MRAFGVANEGRPDPKLFGVPRPVSRALGFGVLTEGIAKSEREGLDGKRVGLPRPMLVESGLPGVFGPRADSCLAVIPTYLLARLPSVILLAEEGGVVGRDGGG